MLSIRDLSVEYSRIKIISNVSFDLYPNEIMVISGTNGSGKTTLLKSIVGLAKPREGEIIFEGKSLIGLQPFFIRKLGIAYLPQHAPIFPDLSVEQNLELSQYAYRNLSKVRQNIQSTSDFGIQLAGSKEIKAGLLSRGQKQLLALSMLMMNYAKLYIFDEPFAPLSSKMKEKASKEMFRLSQKYQASILIIEHEKEVTSSIGQTFYKLTPNGNGSTLEKQNH